MCDKLVRRGDCKEKWRRFATSPISLTTMVKLLYIFCLIYCSCQCLWQLHDGPLLHFGFRTMR